MSKVHLKVKKINDHTEDDCTCPFCLKKLCEEKNKLHDHFKENHIKVKDIHKNPKLSTLKTDEAKEIIDREYDKLLVEYEAKYPESYNSDMELK